MRIIKSGALRPLLLLLFIVSASFAGKNVTFGVIAQDNHSEIQNFKKILKQEIHDLLTGEFEAQFPEDKAVDGDTTFDILIGKLTALEADPTVDMIIVIGNQPLKAVLETANLKKPVIAPMVMDIHISEKMKAAKGSGKTNFTYTSIFPDLERSLKEFVELTGKKEVTVVIDESYSDLELPRAVDSVSLKYLTVSLDAAISDLVIPEDVKALFVTPLYGSNRETRHAFFKKATERGIPTFTIGGITDLRGGALMSLTDSADVQRVARTNAINIQSILLGDKPETLSTEFKVREKMIINMETAVKCSIDVPWKFLSEAEFINRDYSTAERKLTLTGAVEEAITSNLTYLSKIKEVEAGNQDLKTAWSRFLPSLNLGGGLSMIDENSSSVSFSGNNIVLQPEKTFFGEVGFQQLIFSDKVITGIGAQRRLRDSREAEVNQVRKDIALTAATTYLQLLEAQTGLEINESEYLTLKKNLEIAQNGQAVGTTNPADVYRLESEVARQKHRVFESRTAVRRGQLNMNRLLHRPLEEEFITEDSVIIEKPHELALQWSKSISSLSVLDTFRLYLTEIALLDAPELKRINSYIEAKEKEKREYLRGFIVPELVAAGGVQKPFSTSEDDSKYEDSKWQVGIYANWNILSNGDKLVDRKRANYELERLETDRERISEELKNRVQNSLLEMIDMISKVSLYTVSAEAAQKNYDIIFDSYSRGATDIEGLLGAQNAKFQANSQQIAAMYQFRKSELNLERSINRLEEFYNKDFSEILKEFGEWRTQREATASVEATESVTAEPATIN